MCDKFITSWANMVNMPAFWEILLPSSDNVNDCVTYIYRKYANLDENDIAELANLLGEKLCIWKNRLNKVIILCQRKSDEFA